MLGGPLNNGGVNLSFTTFLPLVRHLLGMSKNQSSTDKSVLRAPKRPQPEHRRGVRARRNVSQSASRNVLASKRELGLLTKLFVEAGVLGLTALLGLVGMIAWYAHDLPKTDSLWRPDRAPRYTVLANDGSPLSVQGTRYGAPIRLADLPPHVTDAVLAVEDRNFHHHIGFNPLSVVRAMVVNTGQGRVRQGGSTITQQLAKNLFLSSDRTLKRKVQELLLALWLEQRFNKDEILTLYLNRVYLGAGAYGIDAASYRYFGKPARDLALNEAALIAGLLKAPSRYNPTHNRVDAGLRAQTVIESMVAAGFLTPRAAGEAIRTPIYLKPRKFSAASYFVDHALSEVKRLYPGNDADLVIQTTFDPQLQAAAERGLFDALSEGALPHEGDKRIETAAVLVDGGGAVRAMIGGRDYGYSQFNRATQAKRQPGSAFKPFIYLTAIEAGARPDNLILDAPITIGKWSPDNYKSKFYGEVTLTEALARSLNSATIRLQEWAGRERVRAMAKSMGYSEKLNPDAALALGTDAIAPITLAQAWVPFANGGFAVDAHVIERVMTAEGKVLHAHQNQVHEVVASAQSIAMVNEMLGAVTGWGTGKRAQVPGQVVYGKTGTTQGSRDAWFAGHMSGLVGVVWVGHDNYAPMKGVTGGRAPAIIWGRIMGEVNALIAPRHRPPPPLEEKPPMSHASLDPTLIR